MKGTEIMGFACGNRHDKATEAKSQRQVLARTLEVIEEYPENFGLSLFCNCLSVDPSFLLTLILGKRLMFPLSLLIEK